MDKLEIIKMELDDCLDLDCDIQMILDEGYGADLKKLREAEK